MMPNTRDTREIVPLGLLRRYLAANGWRLDSTPSDSSLRPRLVSNAPSLPGANLLRSRSAGKRNVDVYVLSDPGLDSVELIVPADQGGADFERRLQGAIITLSQVENRTPEQIVESIRSIGFDVVRTSIPDSLVVDDTIHLESAMGYINGMKELLTATATTELKPQPYFSLPPKMAREYSQRCRFGHTYRGSFGFTIESPLLAEPGDMLLNIEPVAPFERRVVQRLATGIRHVCEAVNRNDIAPLVDGFSDGFGANACARFADLIRDTAFSGMSFGFTFSPRWAVPAGIARSVEFVVGPKHVEVARVAADRLRGESVQAPIEILGKVVRLQNEADPSDLSAVMGEGEISVLHADEIHGAIHVRITLVPSEYLKAVEAHRIGKPICISGELVRRGRYWYLNSPSSIAAPRQGELDV